MRAARLSAPLVLALSAAVVAALALDPVLGGHHPGDVIAAIAQALGWLVPCAMATGYARRG